MNEAEIRAEPVDPALKAAGWGVVDSYRTGSDPTSEARKKNKN